MTKTERDVLHELEAAAARKWKGDADAQRAGLFARAAEEITRLRREKDAALNLWPRDCRLCAHYTTQTGGCTSLAQCVDSAQFKATAPRQYWISGLTPA